MLTKVLAVAGAFFGLIGTVLGLLNYLALRRRDKVAIRVHSTTERVNSNGVIESVSLLVHIFNDSHFPITVTKVGCRLRKLGNQPRELVELSLTPPSKSDALPARVEARHTVVLKARCSHRVPLFTQGRKAYPDALRTDAVYATLATGQSFFGRHRHLASFVGAIRDLHASGVAPAT